MTELLDLEPWDEKEVSGFQLVFQGTGRAFAFFFFHQNSKKAETPKWNRSILRKRLKGLLVDNKLNTFKKEEAGKEPGERELDGTWQ